METKVMEQEYGEGEQNNTRDAGLGKKRGLSYKPC